LFFQSDKKIIVGFFFRHRCKLRCVLSGVFFALKNSWNIIGIIIIQFHEIFHIFCFVFIGRRVIVVLYDTIFLSVSKCQNLFSSPHFFCRHCCAKNSFFCFLKPTPNILNKFCNFSWNHFHEIFLFWFFFSNNNWLLCDEEE